MTAIANVANTDTFGTQLSTVNQLVVAVNLLNTGQFLGGNVTLTLQSAFAKANDAYANASNAILTTGGVVTGNINFGASSTLNNPTLSGYKEATTNLGTVSANTFTANLSLTNIFDVRLSNANTRVVFTNPASTGNAHSVTVIYRQPGVSANVINHANTIIWSNGEVPVLSSGIVGRLDIVTYLTVDGGTTFMGAHSMANVG